jgi:hypothetical protein
MGAMGDPCGCDGRERVRYFPRQLVTADDMTAEQEYFRQKLRRHNRYLHGWGVVCGCAVVLPPTPVTGHPWQVVVCPGYLITPQGDEILIGQSATFDVAGDSRQLPDPCPNPSPCSPVSSVGTVPSEQQQYVYLAACYTECQTRPVRLHPSGCGCDESTCDYSRIRDSFELVLLPTLPVISRSTGPAGPGCPSCPSGSCVVLAQIRLPGKEVSGKFVIARDVPLTANDITHKGRMQLYSVAELPRPPTIVNTLPLNGAGGVAATASITAWFSRTMDAATLTTSSMFVDGARGSGSLAYSPATNSVNFVPAASLAPGTHTVTMTAQVADTYGTALIGDYSWTFTSV